MADNNKQYDKMIYSPVTSLVVKMSIPTIISMLVTNIYNLVDTSFIGTLGTSASGAVGVVFGYMAILQAIGFMFGQGGGSIISRHLGNKNVDEASKTASTAIFYSISTAIAVVILSAVFINPLIGFLGSTPTIAPFAKTYITYILITAPFQVASFTMNNILRYEGRAILGMVGLSIGAVLNIGGDALFIFGMDMGIAGAGLSTAISQFISFSILMFFFIRHKTSCRLSFKKISFNIKNVFDIASTGFPSLLRQGLNSVTTILLNSQAAVYGDAAVAAMSITARIVFFIYSAALGIGQGFQPIGGFSYGAKRFDRLKKAYKVTLIYAEIVVVITGAIVFIWAGTFVGLLRNDPEVIAIGARALKLQCIASLFLPLCMVTEMLMQCTGRRLQATILSASRSGIIFIPLLIIMPVIRGLAGIQEAQPLSMLIGLIPAAILAILFFKKLGNKQKNEKGQGMNI